jgi:hypothetical protein
MKTREIVKAVIFVMGMIMLSAACNKKDDIPTLDFNITVPADWSYAIAGGTGLVYQALSPLKTGDTISEDVLVWKMDANNQTLDQFFASYNTAMSKDTSYHRITVVDTTIDGEDAIKMTHLQTVPLVNSATKDTAFLEAKMQKYVMMNKGYGYVVSLDALVSTFKEYKPIFDNIIATFSFK